MSSFDDRLRGHRDLESLMGAAEEVAEELGAEHYDRCYDTEMCAACTEDTPISGEWGPWMHLKSTFDTLVAETEERVESLGEDRHFVQGVLGGAYLESFREAAAAPENCIVCTGNIAGDGPHECGHVKWGDGDCPARD